jgi:hypothetical protein
MDRQGGRQTVNRRLSADEAELHQEWINNDPYLRAINDVMRTIAAWPTDLILEGTRRAEAEV